MDKSTPRPWAISGPGAGGIFGPDGRRLVANTMGQTDGRIADGGLAENNANAALIVRAVNRDAAFDALVEALRLCVQTPAFRLAPKAVCNAARAALALAKET